MYFCLLLCLGFFSTSAFADCSCSDFTNSGYGQCKKGLRSSFGGSPFCYVNLPSNCADRKESILRKGKWFSAQACNSQEKVKKSKKGAKCNFKGDGTKGIHGEIIINQFQNHAVFNGVIVGRIKPGLHGFHVHTKGHLGDNCKAAGGHFNPEGVNHGGKSFDVRHVGDLGNVKANHTGHIRIHFATNRAVLGGPNSIMGRAIVVHEGMDDLGLGGDEGSRTTGNAGPRAGCCIIEPRN